MQALDALVRAAREDGFDGHGWSLAFPQLRQTLQGAAERLLLAESDGASATGMAYALEVGRAVELPATRLDTARAAFEEGIARRRRGRLSEQSELRRRLKEEEEQEMRREEAKARGEPLEARRGRCCTSKERVAPGSDADRRDAPARKKTRARGG